MKLQRLQMVLAGIWAGLLLAIGAIAAPSLFTVLDRVSAGVGAGRIFAVEARVSLLIAIVLYVVERRRVRALAEGGQTGSVMTGNLLLMLAALFLTIFGQFALHPVIEAAKAGERTVLSFGALHGLSATLYWVKTACVVALAWRVTSMTSGAAGEPAAASS